MGIVVALVRDTIAEASCVKAFVLTDIPSPYQVELFNEISAQKTLDLSVAYLRSSDPARSWQPASAEYDCCSLSESSASFGEAARQVVEADVAIFNYYNHPQAEQLIRHRAESGKPWCFVSQSVIVARFFANAIVSPATLAYALNSASGVASAPRPAGRARAKSSDMKSARSLDISIIALSIR